MGFEVVQKLKDINKERIKITRKEQKKIGVNVAIQQAIKKESGETESQAETINRVIKTNRQMTELLTSLVENLERTPSKMTDLLMAIPQNLRNLFEAIINERKEKKDDTNKE